MTPGAKPTVLKAMMIVRAAGWALGLGVFVACAGAAGPVVAAFERFHGSEAPGSAVDGGLLLLNELNCVACHAPPEGWRERLPGRGRISLAGVGSRLDAATLQSFVAEPHYHHCHLCRRCRLHHHCHPCHHYRPCFDVEPS